MAGWLDFLKQKIGDAIYYSSFGKPGTATPAGSPENPVSDLTSLAALFGVRLTTKVYDAIDLTGAIFNGYIFEGTHPEVSLVTINNGTLTNCTFERLKVTFTGYNGAQTMVFRDCGPVAINSLTAGTVILENSGDVTITGHVGGTINIKGARSVTINGQTNAAATINIFLERGILVTIAAGCTAGIINVYGSAVVSGAGGGSTVNNYTETAKTAAIKTQTDKIAGKMLFSLSFYSNPQLGLTVPAVAGTLALPSVVVAGLPAGATVVHAKAILTSRVIENLNAALNKLDGATVAATSQVIQIKKGAGAWNDAIIFIDDQFSINGSTREGGPVVVDATDVAAVVTGNDTYSFQWLLAKADLASLYLQGVHMIIKLDYSI